MSHQEDKREWVLNSSAQSNPVAGRYNPKCTAVLETGGPTLAVSENIIVIPKAAAQQREEELRRERDEVISKRLAGADEKVQMYNLGGEYPELPTRLLAWPDFCTQTARAEQAEAQRDALAEALREIYEQARGTWIRNRACSALAALEDNTSREATP